jgi:hypothetical protein
VYTNKAPKASKPPVGYQERTDKADFNQEHIEAARKLKSFLETPDIQQEQAGLVVEIVFKGRGK